MRLLRATEANERLMLSSHWNTAADEVSYVITTQRRGETPPHIG